MEYRDRINKIVEAMAAEEIDIVVGFSPAIHHVDFGDSVTLLSGVKSLGPSFCVLNRNGEMELVCSPSWDKKRIQKLSRVKNLETTDNLKKVLRERFAGKEKTLRIGTVELEKMPHVLVDEFKETLKGQLTNLNNLVFGAATQKTKQELENAREATRIAEKTYEYLLEITEPGIPEYTLAAEMKCYSLSLGADDNFMMFHAERHPQAVQPSGERRLEKGDLILAEITPSYNGQFAQVCRTIFLGSPTREHIEKYDLVVEAMMNGISQAKPGVPIKEICKGVDEILRAADYAEFCEPPYMNRRGHGLGLSSMEPGDISLINETILEEDMFFVVHPNQYIPEVGYLLCGEPIIITPEGAEIVTKNRASLGIVHC